MTNKVKISFRAREEIVKRIDRLAQERGVPRSNILEEVIENYDRSEFQKVLKESCGAWKRDESPEETVENARRLFNEAMLKHQR